MIMTVFIGYVITTTTNDDEAVFTVLGSAVQPKIGSIVYRSEIPDPNQLTLILKWEISMAWLIAYFIAIYFAVV